jgi:anti-anti-sigma factor
VTVRERTRRVSQVFNESPAGLPGFVVTVAAGTVTVILSGEFDVMSDGFLADRLASVRQGRPRRLIFEAARVGFIDCGSARLIAGADRWLPPGVKPVIVRPSPVVRRVFLVSGLSARCELEPGG